MGSEINLAWKLGAGCLVKEADSFNIYAIYIKNHYWQWDYKAAEIILI
jgi:hypothetical protein